MGGRAAPVVYVLALVATVVGVDILFFRHHFWARLLANVGIVLVFAAFFVRFRHALGGN
jgi:predicted cobalt transporter CbtA